MTVGWFPRFNPDGSRLTWERPGYWLAQWLTPDTEIAQNGTHLVIGGQVTAHPGCNELSAGWGRWAAWRPDVGVFTSWGLTVPGAGCPVISPDGKFGYVDDRQADAKSLIFGGQHVSHGAITDVRASRTALVWSQGGRTWGLRLDRADTAHDIQAAPVEFRPIPIDTPDGPWVLNHTHTGIVVRPFGEMHGYQFDNGGQTFYPDAVWRHGVIRTIFTNDRGEQSEHPFDTQFPRVPLTASPKRPDPIEPEKKPKDPTMTYVPQAPDITHLVRARAAKSPVEWEEARKRPGHDRTDRFVRLLAADAHAFDPRFGLNGKRGGDELSTDVLAFKNPTVPASCGGVELRDFIKGDTHEAAWGDATIVPGMRPDLPNGVPGKWIQPAAVVPNTGGGPGETPPPPPPASGPGAAIDAVIGALRAQLAASQAQIAALQSKVTALEARPAPQPGGLAGGRFAIKTSTGKYICEDRDRSATEDGSHALLANRDDGGPWETFTLEPVR